MARSLSAQTQCRFDAPGVQRFAFSTELSACRNVGENGIAIIVPENVGRRGTFPGLIQREGLWWEWNCLVTHIRDEQANGRSPTLQATSQKAVQMRLRGGLG